MTVPTSASATLTIAATPELLYDLISDVTRMGEWSPECTSCEWIDTPGKPGSRFRGHNRRGPARWTTTAKVLRAEPGVAWRRQAQLEAGLRATLEQLKRFAEAAQVARPDEPQ